MIDALSKGPEIRFSRYGMKEKGVFQGFRVHND